MLVSINSAPEFAIVDDWGIPRFWATAWATGLAGPKQSRNTLRTFLRHLDDFYAFCDRSAGALSLDDALSRGHAEKVQSLVDLYYLSLTGDPKYNTTSVQRWSTVVRFLRTITVRMGSRDVKWLAFDGYLRSIAKLRKPATGRFRFVRALPDVTLEDLLSVAEPGSSRNPFAGRPVQIRNWLILNLLLLCGLRRGEALLLTLDSLKHEVDRRRHTMTYWLDVTTTDDNDDGRSTRPGIKTQSSHRQVPVTEGLAHLYETYVSDARVDGVSHTFLLTSKDGDPLSAESVNSAFVLYTAALSPVARDRFRQRTGQKENVSPHDLRHTCATARWPAFLGNGGDRNVALQRMRAFFGWSKESQMPEVYARAAIQDDLLRFWASLFDRRVDVLRAVR
jgi:integrase